MVTQYYFDCPVCGKHFEIKGRWWNQCVMHHYLGSKYLIHRILKKEYKSKKKMVCEVLRILLIWFPLLLMQLIDFLLEPFRRLYE